MRYNTNCEKENEIFYKIGVFSNMNHVTIKALRYYDEQGLLKPAKVDSENGYRYYTSAQLPILHQIIGLRNMGFRIEDIKKIQDGFSIDTALTMKKNDLLRDLAQITDKIARIESAISNNGNEYLYQTIIKELPQVTVGSMRKKIDRYDDLFSIMPQMGAELERLGCECIDPGYCFSVYHDGGYKAEDIDVEICESVTEAKEDTDLVTFKTIPHVKQAVCVLHKGPYEDFPKAYASLISYIEENGYEIDGLPREFYIDGIWNKDSQDEWLTEIQMPVKKLT